MTRTRVICALVLAAILAAGAPAGQKAPGERRLDSGQQPAADSTRGGSGQGAGQARTLDTVRAAAQAQPVHPQGPVVTFPEMSVRWQMAAGAAVLLGALMIMLNGLRRKADLVRDIEKANPGGEQS